MQAFFPFITLLLFLLVAETTDARKDLGEYWSRNVLRDQLSLPKAISSSSTSNEVLNKVNNNFAEDFKQPDLSISHGDIDDQQVQDKSFSDEFGPADTTIYHNDIVKQVQEKSFSDELGPADTTIYHNDIVKQIRDKSFSDEFKQPDAVLAYHNDIVKQVQDKSFSDDFKQPHVTIYDNKQVEGKLFEPIEANGEEKSWGRDIESKPNFAVAAARFGPRPKASV